MWVVDPQHEGSYDPVSGPKTLKTLRPGSRVAACRAVKPGPPAKDWFLGRSMSIKLLIADDHAFVRDSLAELFADVDDISVVATCADGSEVVPAAARRNPDVVLMDLQMPKMAGLEATQALLAVQPQVRVVILTGAFTPAAAKAAKAIGAAGFLLKGEGADELPELIRVVAAGGTAWSDTAASALVGANGASSQHERCWVGICDYGASGRHTMREAHGAERGQA